MENDTIKLDQFLKQLGIAPTGGQAKLLIQSGGVTVNGETENRRGRKLVAGDRVFVRGELVGWIESDDESKDPRTPSS